MAAIDTHKIIKELVSSGVKEKEAEVLVSNFVSKGEFLELEKDKLGLATKHDIELLKTEIVTEQRWIKALMLLVLGLLIKIAFF